MTAELLLVRHAPSSPAGRLYGRTDVSADLADTGSLSALRHKLGQVDACWCSPAKRCQQTADALFGNQMEARLDDQLWEQNFGRWDGLPFDEVPDLGSMTPDSLAAHRPPEGEIFNEVCTRVQLALHRLVAECNGRRVAVVTHAGVVRAALAMAIGSNAAALSFDVQTLSITQIRVLESGVCSIGFTNWVASCN